MLKLKELNNDAPDRPRKLTQPPAAMNSDYILLTGIKDPERLRHYFASSLVDIAYAEPLSGDQVKVRIEDSTDLRNEDHANWILDCIVNALREIDEDEFMTEIVLANRSKRPDAIDCAIRRMVPHGIIQHGERALSVAFLLRERDWRPLQAPWWRGKEVCIIGADLDGNFYLRHCDGSVRLWVHPRQSDEVVAPSVKEFADLIQCRA